MFRKLLRYSLVFSDDESSASEGVEITAMKCSCIHCVRGDAAVSVPIPVEDDIPIPDPALGAQRKETLKRMRSKTSPVDADDQKQMQKKQDKNKKQNEKQKHEKPMTKKKPSSRRAKGDEDRAVQLPMHIVTRKASDKRRFEMYIMDSCGYVCGLSDKTCSEKKVAATLYQLAGEIHLGRIDTVRAAKAFLLDSS